MCFFCYGDDSAGPDPIISGGVDETITIVELDD